jgi:hypothetical protein
VYSLGWAVFTAACWASLFTGWPLPPALLADLLARLGATRDPDLPLSWFVLVLAPFAAFPLLAVPFGKLEAACQRLSERLEHEHAARYGSLHDEVP